MRYILSVLFMLFSAVNGFISPLHRGFTSSALKMATNLHSFKLKDLTGVEQNLSKYAGKVVLLENVASL